MRDGLVSKEELEEILRDQQDTRQQRISGRRLGEILIQRGRVTPTQVARLVAEQYELPFVDFDVADLDARAAALLSEDDARRFSAVPISRRPDGTYLLAIADPATVLFSDELRKLLDSVPRFVVVGPDAIERAIDFVHGNPQPTADDALERETVVVPFSQGDAAPASDSPAGSHGPLAQTWPPLGALLVRDGYLTDADLDTALARQRLSPSHRLGEILVQSGVVAQSVVARLVAEQYELPFVGLAGLDVDPATARRLPQEVARRLCAVPIASSDEGRLEVAIADPTNAVYSDELQQALDAPLTFVVASPDEIEALVDAVHAPTPVLEHVEPAAETRDDMSSFVLDEPPVQALETGAHETAPVWTVADVHSEEATVPTQPESSFETVEPVAPHSEEEEPAVFELVFPPFPAYDTEPEPPLEQHDEPLPPAEETTHTFAFDSAPDAPATSGEETAHTFAFDSTPDEPVVTSDFEVGGDLVPPVELVGPMELQEPTDEVIPAPVTEPVEDEPTVPGPPEAEADVPQDHELLQDVEEEETQAEPAVELQGLTGGFEALFTAPFVVPATSGPTAGEDPIEPVIVAVDVEPVEDHTEPVEHVEPGTETVESAVADVVPLVVALEPVVPDDDLESAVASALAAGAATLHFSPQAGDFSVRARVDGLVRELGTATTMERDTLVTRLEAEGTVRTHVVPTFRGDKTTLFVVDRPGEPTTLAGLGPDPRAVEELRAALAATSGAVLVSGPTRSGTTTTLYAALTELATPDRVVTTVELPVERELEGVDQIEVDADGGSSYADVLQRLRFTDSDVVLVGELGDGETAALTLRAAYEGRRVLAGLRAPSATAAVARLTSMGVDTALLASSLSSVVSQRLVRTICPDCRETHYASEAELEMLGHVEDGAPRLLAHGRGCDACEGSGFRGRTALFEVLPMTPEVRRLVGEGASESKLRRAAAADGARTLREEGVRLCLEGVTTVAELERVLDLED
jgi:type IV pilus assembly protein PilB